MIICMILGTVMFTIFVFLYLGAGEAITENMLNCTVETLREKIKNLDIDIELFKAQLKEDKSLDKKKSLKKAKALKTKRDQAEKMLITYEKRKVIGLDLIPIAGYNLIRLLGWDMKNKYIKKMYDKCIRYKERREAVNYTFFVYGNLFGNILLGLALGFLVSGIMLAMDMEVRSFVVGLGIVMLFFILGILPYDEVERTVKKREEEIEKDFLQVVSQLTLLVVAGMEVNRAWRLSENGGSTTLYSEMKRVDADLDNGVTPLEAYGKFITRCGNKFTTRLATAVSQNMSKGNSEIVNLFTKLNSESWSEYRHGSRRMAEKLQSKLFIPTILMFLGILILVIVPVVAGFNF